MDTTSGRELGQGQRIDESVAKQKPLLGGEFVDGRTERFSKRIPVVSLEKRKLRIHRGQRVPGRVQ